MSRIMVRRTYHGAASQPQLNGPPTLRAEGPAPLGRASVLLEPPGVPATTPFARIFARRQHPRPGRHRTLAAVALAVAASAQVPQPAKVNVLAGRVEHQGQAVGDAAVVVRWLAHPELPGPLALALPDCQREQRAKTDAAGSFRLELPDRGPFAVWTETEAGLRSPLQFPVLAGDFLRLEPVACPVLHGTVVDQQGRPVAGARVASTAYGDIDDYAQRYRFPQLERSVLTDADGRFAYPQWPPPAPFISPERSLRASDGRFASADRFYLQAGQTTAQLTLQMRQSAVAPRRAGAGERAGGDRATVVFADGTLGRATVHGDGRTSLDRPPRTEYQGGYLERDGRFVPFDAILDPASGAVFALPGPTHELHGAVFDVEFQPLPAARVMLYSAGMPGRSYCVTYTDRGGWFWFDAVPHGPLEIGVVAGEAGARFVTAPAGPYPKPLRITMQGLRVKGSVVFRPGEPAANAEVQYCIQDDRFGSVYAFLRAGDDGCFELRGLPPGATFTSYAFCVRDGAGFMSQETGTFTAGSALLHALRQYPGRF